MALFGLFRKKDPNDGTYRRDRGKDGQPKEYGFGEDPYEIRDNTPYETQCTTQGETARGFRMEVQDVFAITGRGTVVTGKVAAGTVSVGDKVILRRTDGTRREVTISGIEMFRKMTDRAVQGDNVGLLLQGVDRKETGRGDVLEG